MLENLPSSSLLPENVKIWETRVNRALLAVEERRPHHYPERIDPDCAYTLRPSSRLIAALAPMVAALDAALSSYLLNSIGLFAANEYLYDQARQTGGNLISG